MYDKLFDLRIEDVPGELRDCFEEVETTCGAPWRRVVERGLTAHDGETASAYATGSTANRLALLRQAARERGEEYSNRAQTTGWLPSCTCYGPDIPTMLETPDKPDEPDTDKPASCPECNGTGAITGLALFGEPDRTCDRCNGTGAQNPPAEWLVYWADLAEWQTEADRITAANLAALRVVERMNLPTVPALVLDPFSGTGTTCAVAAELGRNAVGVDIAAEYNHDHGAARIERTQPALIAAGV